MSNLRLHDVVLKEVAETDEDFTWQVGTSFREQGMTFPTFLRILFGIEKERIPKYRPDPFAVHADRRSQCSRSRTLITYRITYRDSGSVLAYRRAWLGTASCGGQCEDESSHGDLTFPNCEHGVSIR
jgi:hypothetical protein